MNTIEELRVTCSHPRTRFTTSSPSPGVRRCTSGWPPYVAGAGPPLGAVAAVVAMVGGVGMLPRLREPDAAAQRHVAGQVAPVTLDSLGYT
jgi:hypothetical protein